ncbi:UbiD family decarboxylase [Apiospora arundinis]|uniref:UbiD family decarboxylase n=1 Tax=Apiospora arundinis TaxID=335852 RepID=A0ABR2IX52_9PEZI
MDERTRQPAAGVGTRVLYGRREDAEQWNENTARCMQRFSTFCKLMIRNTPVESRAHAAYTYSARTANSSPGLHMSSFVLARGLWALSSLLVRLCTERGALVLPTPVGAEGYAGRELPSPRLVEDLDDAVGVVVSGLAALPPPRQDGGLVEDGPREAVVGQEGLRVVVGKEPADAAIYWSLTSPRTKHSLRRPGLIRFAIVATAHYSKADTISYPISKLSSIFPGHVSLAFDDNMKLGTQGSQPIFDQYHKAYGEILTGFPAKDIRKQYKSQTSHTLIEPDDGSFGQDDTGAVNFNLEPFQLHDGVRTSSGDVDESIETGSVFENPRDDPMLPTLQTQPNCRPERSRVSLEPATNPCHSRSSCSLEVDHDPQASLVGNESQDSDLDLGWANTFRYRRLANRRQERAAASLRRITFPRPTAKSQNYTKALLENRAKAKIQNCTSKRQKQTYAKIRANGNKKGASGIVQGSLSKSKDWNTAGPSAGEDRALQTDAHISYSYIDSQATSPLSLLSTGGSSKSKERICGTASICTPQAPRRQSPSDQSVRAASRHRTHQWTEDQDPMAVVESNLLLVGDGTGTGTDTRTPRSSILELADKRTRGLRPAQPAKGPPGGITASSGLFKGMAFALSFNSEDEAGKQLTKSLIQRASGKILVTGFDELFEPACLGLPLELSPSTEARSLAIKSDFQATSFTALIADSHSRKAKYMQALALGFPCLSAKWISRCISRGKVVDWSSYVRCAGSSRVLGGAIRSRDILIYEASSKTLPETLEERPAFLRNMFILVVREEGSERNHMPYLILLRMLGATVVGARSLEQARAKMESSTHAFDFIYITGQGASAEQSRRSTNNNYPLHGIRVLTGETLVQSIILGRLLEEDEMEE